VRKLLRNKKAVSNVVGTILMILVVTVGMSMAFAYFVNFVKNYQAGNGSSVMELVDIEDVWFKTGGNVTVWLYNYGKVDLTVGSLYVDGQSVDLNSITIPIGSHNETTVHVIDPEWVAGITHHFKFVTERGSDFESDYTVPTVLG
jgi:hypothetical protein